MIKNNLREIRKSKNLSQEKLALLCDLSQNSISNIELQNNQVSVNTAHKLMKALDVEFYELFYEV